MELPKNITQIGESNPHCKVYVEDYVISYIKQLNQSAGDRAVGVALYGIGREEAGVTYIFFYGACRAELLQKECRHLSQAVQQEVEKKRRKHFPEYTFLGYCILNGEMVEGFHVCEQNVCRYIEGYAQFYEKNDKMLAFMLEERQEEVKPEAVDQSKYDEVKKRQEERRAAAEGRGGHAVRPQRDQPEKPGKTEGVPPMSMRNMKIAAAGVFTFLGVVGLAAMGGSEGFGEWRAAAGRLVEGITEKQLPDAAEVGGTNVQVGTIVAEDKLTDAIRKENTQPDASQSFEQGAIEEEGTQSAVVTPEPATPTPEPPTPTPEPATPTPEPPTPTPEPPAPIPEPVSYTIQRGDTLIGICIKKYGSDKRVAEVCALNHINNPDDIKEGEKILLP